MRRAETFSKPPGGGGWKHSLLPRQKKALVPRGVEKFSIFTGNATCLKFILEKTKRNFVVQTKNNKNNLDSKLKNPPKKFYFEQF
jgi:hypothetical protein